MIEEFILIYYYDSIMKKDGCVPEWNTAIFLHHMCEDYSAVLSVSAV